MNPVTFAEAVAAVREAPFGQTLEALKLHISDAKAELKQHMNPGYAEARVQEIVAWMDALNRLERANEAAKLNDWEAVK